MHPGAHVSSTFASDFSFCFRKSFATSASALSSGKRAIAWAERVAARASCLAALRARIALPRALGLGA